MKCRKAGASNWGNSTKKEEVEHVNETKEGLMKVGREQYKKEKEEGRYGETKPSNERVAKLMKKMKEETMDEARKPGESPKDYANRVTKKYKNDKTKTYDPMKDPNFDHDKAERTRGSMNEACWKGYEKKGMKTMFGKRYPNCVKKEETETVSERDRVFKALEEAKGKKNCGCGKDPCITYGPKKNAHKMSDGTVMPGKSHDESESIDESTRIPSQNGNVYMVTFTWKGKFMVMKVFFPEVKRPSKSQVQDALNKVYPGCVVKRYDMTDIQPGETHLNIGMGEETEIEEDMSGMSQKSGDKRSTKSGAGMTAKGVAKYNRRTGGNLKTAVTTPPSKLKPGSKAAGRRKSFCARSRSWTGERGKAARRRWNC